MTGLVMGFAGNTESGAGDHSQFAGRAQRHQQIVNSAGDCGRLHWLFLNPWVLTTHFGSRYESGRSFSKRTTLPLPATLGSSSCASARLATTLT